MKDFIFPMNLQLFAEGGAPSGDGGGEGTGVTAQAAAVQTKGAKSNPLAGVVYGKQKESAPAAEVQKDAAPKEEPKVDLDAEFEELIKGKYKDQYGKRVQNTVQQRLKGSKETEDRLNAMNPLMDLLSARYGVKADDTEGLIKALEGDDAFFEQAAQEHNMDAKEYRKMLQLQSENTRLKSQQEQQFRQDQMNKQYEAWEQQAEEARKLYPNLDLNIESQNPQFRQLLFQFRLIHHFSSSKIRVQPSWISAQVWVKSPVYQGSATSRAIRGRHFAASSPNRRRKYRALLPSM